MGRRLASLTKGLQVEHNGSSWKLTNRLGAGGFAEVWEVVTESRKKVLFCLSAATDIPLQQVFIVNLFSLEPLRHRPSNVALHRLQLSPTELKKKLLLWGSCTESAAVNVVSCNHRWT